MGVALSPCTIPAAGVPTFELPVGQMEIGMGIHGEPGVRRGPLATADEIATELMHSILADLPYRRGDEVGVLVNGLGATPKEELYILYRSVDRILAGEGIRVHRCG
jgi:dihydroxyacetone kinase